MTMTEHRRALHQIPETGWDVKETAQYIKTVLQGLSCQVFSPVENAVCAYFDFGGEHTVAFRSDMDALPLTETTGLEFSSRHPGRMHACGHDGHMAILLGLAEYVSAQKELGENVLLIFQPAEETTGGAKPLCDTGLLENYRVRRIYGLHLWPALEKGVVGSCPGAMMSRSCELSIEISGRSAHIARWQKGRDALYAGVLLLSRFYETVEGEPCVLRFGRMDSGSVRNAVSDRTVLEGSLRTLDDEMYEDLTEEIGRICQDVAEETGCKITARQTSGYPPVTNDPALLQQARERFSLTTVEPTYITEDFSHYQRHVPGVFFWLGTGGTALHRPDFDFDEDLLNVGLELFKALL